MFLISMSVLLILGALAMILKVESSLALGILAAIATHASVAYAAGSIHDKDVRVADINANASKEIAVSETTAKPQ